MPTMFRVLPAAFVLLLTTAAAPSDSITTDQLINRLGTSIDQLKYLRCTVQAKERLPGGGYQIARTQMKVSYEPHRIYVRNQKGIEVLWVQGQNGGDAWVYPNAFPYVTVSLDPKGVMMRKNQHHSVLDAGYGVISDLIRTSPQRTDTYRRSFRYAGDTTVQGRACYILRSDFPQFRYVSYKPAKAETTEQIADRFGCGEFRILERNKLDPNATVSAGTAVLVPNAYGSRTIVSIDQKTMLPLSVSVWDDKGLFETFEFQNVVANQPISAAEFTKEYKEYKF